MARSRGGWFVSEQRPTTDVPCFVCGKDLPRAFPDTAMQPMGGVACQASGNYGSAVFDPFQVHGFLAFIVCDDCITAGEARMRLGKVSQPRPTVHYFDAALAFEKETFDVED